MLNRVVLIGRMTRDPELRRTATNNMAVVSFTVAVDDSRKGPNGEKNTLFMNCSMFGQKAENVIKFTHKGSLVAVEGRLNQRSYVRKADNVKVTVVETIAENVEFLDPKSAATNSVVPSTSNSGYQPDSTPAEGESGTLDDLTDDELPF